MVSDTIFPQKRNDFAPPEVFRSLSRSCQAFGDKKDLMSMEMMISKMTGLPAPILGIKDRGTIGKRGKKLIWLFLTREQSEALPLYENPFASSSVFNLLL